MYAVLSVDQAVVPQSVLRVRQEISPCSSMSSVGVPTKSVTMAKKRESISSWGASAAVMRSVWAIGCRPYSCGRPDILAELPP